MNVSADGFLKRVHTLPRGCVHSDQSTFPLFDEVVLLEEVYHRTTKKKKI